MGLGPVFSDLYENNVTQKNYALTYPLNILHEAYKNRSATRVHIAQRLVEELLPYKFNVVIEKNLNTLQNLLEKYQEEVIIVKAIDTIKRSRTGKYYNDVLEKLETYLYESDKSKRRILIDSLKPYAYEPIVRETMKALIKFEDEKSLYLVNENQNFNIKPIYSFVYFDNELKETYFFSNLGKVYSVGKELKVLTEEEIAKLPRTFLQMNEYIQRPNIRINNQSLVISLANSTIEFMVNENKENEAYLNNVKISTTQPYEYLIQSGLFGQGTINELSIIGKIWDNLDTLIEMDFGKNIMSKSNLGLSSSIFKIDEKFYVHRKNLLQNYNEVTEGLNGLQARNAILEFMKFDITESLFEYLEGTEAEIAKFKNDQKIIQKDIQTITEEIAKIDNAINNPTIGPAEELTKVRESLVDEIEFLKGKYNELSEEINKINSPELNEDENELKSGDMVKIKGSEMTGSVMSINTVTKSVSILTDKGETIEVTMADIEKITDEIIKDLDDIEKKAKDVEKTEVAENEELKGEEELTEGERLFGHLKKEKSK